MSASILIWATLIATQKSPWLDVPYVQNAEKKQHLDLYLPEATNFATIVFVHGGAWVMGDRKQPPYPELGKMFSKQGYGFAVISYRLSPSVKHPAHTEDAAAAFAWMKKNIASRGGDSRKVFLMGHSAGGHIVALLASDKQYLEKHGLKPSDISGVIAMGAPMSIDGMTGGSGGRSDSGAVFPNDAEGRKAASPINHISRDMPQMLLMVASQDIPILKVQARAYLERAKSAGVDVAYFEMPDRNHITTMTKLTDPNDVVVKRIVDFIKAKTDQ